MEFTWADANDQKYFHVFDTETQTLEAIANPLTLFEKIYYDDTAQDYTNYDINNLTGKFVKVIVGNKSNPFMFDKFIERISDLDTHDLKIVSTFSPKNSEKFSAIFRSCVLRSDILSINLSNINGFDLFPTITLTNLSAHISILIFV